MKRLFKRAMRQLAEELLRSMDADIQSWPKPQSDDGIVLLYFRALAVVSLLLCRTAVFAAWAWASADITRG